MSKNDEATVRLILAGDGSERMKQGAVYILAQNGSPEAWKLIHRVAESRAP